jgi:hypothetical protein
MEATRQNSLKNPRVSIDKSPTLIFSLMVSLSPFINEYAMQWIRGLPEAHLGLYGTEFRRNSVVSLSPFDNSESADDSFFYDPSSPAPAVRPKSKSIDGWGNDLDRRVIASFMKSSCDHRDQENALIISNKWLDDDEFSGVKFLPLLPLPRCISNLHFKNKKALQYHLHLLWFIISDYLLHQSSWLACGGGGVMQARGSRCVGGLTHL